MQEQTFKTAFEKGEQEESPTKERESLGDKMVSIELRLGDIIKITTEGSMKNEYYIEYIDREKIKAIDVETLEKIEFTIDEKYELVYNGVRVNGKIALLYRQKEEGFARQNGLIVDTWIAIRFDIKKEQKEIIAKIIELPEDLDMITILTHPQKDTLYINFNYNGLSENLHISSLKIISSPYTEENFFEMVPDIEEEYDDDNATPTKEYRSPPIFEFGEMIPLGKVADIVYLVNADESQYRYDIETQKNDLLNNMLSKLPKSQRTMEELSNIALIIERFRQLRQQFSVVDSYGNITGAVQKGAKWKPLVENLKTFKRPLYWIVPVGTQTKVLNLIAKEGGETEPDEEEEEINPEFMELFMQQNKNKDVEINKNEPDDQLNLIVQEFKKANISDNRYIKFIQQLYRYFWPFRYNIQRSNILTSIPIITPNINVMIDNGNRFMSNIVDVSVKKTKGSKNVTYDIKEQKYITGVYLPEDMVLHASKITSDIRMTVEREKVYNTNDHIDLVSILTLPEPVIQFSRVNLPGTNIMEKSGLSNSFIDFSEIFKKTSKYDNLIKTISLNNLDNEETVKNLQQMYDNTSFIGKRMMTSYVTNTVADTEQNKNLYDTYLNLIIPQSRILFDLIKKYVTGRMSIMDVICYLEPFLIYQDDVTFKFYEELKKFVENKCREYKKQLRDKNTEFNTLKERLKTMNNRESYIKSKCCKLANLIDRDTTDSAEIYNLYGFPEIGIANVDTAKNIHPTSSELLQYLTKIDFHRMLSYRIINVSLLVHNKTDEMIRIQGERMDEWNNPGECDNKYVIAKVYNNETDLKNDDGKSPIYFDRRLNSGQTCERDTTVREIVDGDMAALYSIGQDSFQYYRRADDRWKEEDIDASVFSGEFICGLKEHCMQNAQSGDCSSMDMVRMNITKKNIDNVLQEFDRSIEIQTNELKEEIEKNYLYYKDILPKVIRIEINKQYGKYEHKRYELGEEMKRELQTEDEIIVSPYLKLRDIILGQSNFEKLQRDIITFKEQLTLSVNTSVDPEEQYWFYCNKTNTKLLPKFLYVLADTYISNSENYDNVIQELCKFQGKISDDGDSWVDKYSGYVIRKIDYDVEEGYENGFKASSRSKLEAESNIEEIEEITDIQTQSREKPAYITYIHYKTIIHIIDTLYRALRVSLDDKTQNDFIANLVHQLMGKIYTRDQFIKIYEKKGKTYDTEEYMKYVNKNLLFYTIVTFITALQTNVPIIKVNGKNYTMNEYPLQPDGGKETFQYIVRILLSLKTLQGSPWNTIFNKSKSMKVDKVIENLELVRGQVISQDLVEHRKNMKTIDLEKSVEEGNDEYNISRWTQFLPPLFDIHMRHEIEDVNAEFKSRLSQKIHSGDGSQYDEINVLRGKIILFSLGIVVSIQQVISRETLLLESTSGKYYLENACCVSSKEGNTVIGYFSNENKNIERYIGNAISDGNILADIRAMTMSPALFCRKNSKDKYPAINMQFNEQTIYMAFIMYCHFQSLKPMNDKLKVLCHCKQKPVAFDINDTIRQKIEKIKSSGKNYQNEDLLGLLKYIGENNIVHLYIDSERVMNPFENMKRILNGTVREEYERIEVEWSEDPTHESEHITHDGLPPILDKISTWLDKIDISNAYHQISNSDRSAFIDEIITANTGLKNKIFGKLPKREKSVVQERFNNLFSTVGQTVYNTAVFIKHYIYFISSVFPKMLIDYKFDKQSSNIFSNILPKYLKLSPVDSNQILKITERHYEALTKFYNKYETDIFIIQQNEGECGSWFCNMLHKVKERTSPIITLMNNTPLLSNIHDGKEKVMPLLEEKTVLSLLENYLLNILYTYQELFRETFQEDDNLINELIKTYITMMIEHKITIAYTYQSVVDIEFKSQEIEKYLMTDRLKDLLASERKVDTLLKKHKLGAWGVGLKKEFFKYSAHLDKNEEQFVNELKKVEEQLRKEHKLHGIQDTITMEMLLDMLEETMVEEIQSKILIDKDKRVTKGPVQAETEDGDGFGDEDEDMMDDDYEEDSDDDDHFGYNRD